MIKKRKSDLLLSYNSALLVLLSFTRGFPVVCVKFTCNSNIVVVQSAVEVKEFKFRKLSHSNIVTYFKGHSVILQATVGTVMH